MASLPTYAHHATQVLSIINHGKIILRSNTPSSHQSINAQSVPDNSPPFLVFPVTTPNASHQPPIKAETWSSSVLTVKPHSARKEVEADQNVQRTKERWSQEELSFMAECEASIPLHITNRNQLLQPYFPHRTIESIKGVRKGER